MTTGPERVPGLCKHPIGHTGRCNDGYGKSWDNNHPDCEGCVRWKRWGLIAMEERDQAEGDLRRLRDALSVVLDDQTRASLTAALEPAPSLFTDTKQEQERT